MKKLSFFVVLFFVLCGTSLIYSQTQIASGSFSASTGSSDYTLDTNTGERTVLVEVNFKKSFDKKPQVVLSVTHCDIDNKANTRYDVEATSISRDGFVVKIKTWSDSKIYSIQGNWLAYSE